MSRKEHRQRSGGEQLIGSFTLIAVMGVLFFTMHGAWWPLLVAALCIPGIARGFQRIASQRRPVKVRTVAPPPPNDGEDIKQILRVAQKLGGVVTPTLVTINTSLSLDRAEHLLQEMSGKGYASMNVTDSGRIEYEFPEFVEHPGDGALPS